MWNKIKNPIKSKVKSQEEIAKMTSDQILLMEIDNIKSNIKRLIWQLRLEGKLNSVTANSLSKDLGRVNKNLENLLFDLQINSSEFDIGRFVLELKPIVADYNALYMALFEKIEAENNVTPLTSEGLCLSYLQ